ncbi:MAG: transposase family protein [Terracidiphilus sp.]
MSQAPPKAAAETCAARGALWDLLTLLPPRAGSNRHLPLFGKENGSSTASTIIPKEPQGILPAAGDRGHTHAAVLSGAGGWDEIERSGRGRKARLKGLRALPHGIPSHDPFHRVFQAPEPADLKKGSSCPSEGGGAVEGGRGGGRPELAGARRRELLSKKPHRPARECKPIRCYNQCRWRQ